LCFIEEVTLWRTACERSNLRTLVGPVEGTAVLPGSISLVRVALPKTTLTKAAMSQHHTAVFDAWQTACAYADVAATSHATAPTWQEHQTVRLEALLHDAAQHSRFYGQRLKAAGQGQTAHETLQRIRPVHKRELMQHFADWVADPALTLPALRAFARERSNRGEAFLGRYLVWESSGSSGEPALFVQDQHALAVADALEAARGPISLAASNAWSEWWMGSGAGVERIALVAATDGHFASVVTFERARALNPWLGATSHSFSFLQPMAHLVEQLNAFAPTVLASYPSMAWVLSEEQRAGRLKIAPHAVWTGGETLTPATRRTLGERFHAPVRDSYGASECFLIANECRCGQLHLNADWVILEPVDSRGHAVEPGEFGATTLLTNLSNHVQPIIRYDLGDRVRFVRREDEGPHTRRVAAGPPRGARNLGSGPSFSCECGSTLPVIEVQGRADDVLTLADASGHAVHLAPLALTTVLEDEAGVFDFQLAQRGPRSLRLDVHGGGSSKGAAEALRKFLHEQGLGATRLQCHGDSGSTERGRSGKQRRVVGEHATAVNGAAHPRARGAAARAKHATA
jgi:phenylacetate-CoA ligase